MKNLQKLRDKIWKALRRAVKRRGNTQRTFEETQKVTDTFKEVYSGAVKLREIADKLAESVSYFKM